MTDEPRPKRRRVAPRGTDVRLSRSAVPRKIAETRSKGTARTRLTDLPVEILEEVTRFLIWSSSGPEIYIGTYGGLQWKAYENLSNVSSCPCYNCVETRGKLGPTFSSSITKREEVLHLFTCIGTKQRWPQSYHVLLPLTACKSLYYPATAVFFKEKTFVLGSSSYAQAWLRRVGQRNQVNLRSVRFNIQREIAFVTHDLVTQGRGWVEVLKTIGRSAKQLKVLGFQIAARETVYLDSSPLFISLLRMRSFENLRQIDFFGKGCFGYDEILDKTLLMNKTTVESILEFMSTASHRMPSVRFRLLRIDSELEVWKMYGHTYCTVFETPTDRPTSDETVLLDYGPPPYRWQSIRPQPRLVIKAASRLQCTRANHAGLVLSLRVF